MKGSVGLEKLSKQECSVYADACGVMLARAHAQSFPIHELVGYLGGGNQFDRAMLAWSKIYAVQVN